MKPTERLLHGLLDGPLIRVACVLTALVPAACEDGPTDPVALLVAEEAREALSVESGLPSVTSLTERIRGGERAVDPGRLDEWSGAWQASWLAGPAEGARVRERLYDRAVEPLADALGAEGVRTAVERTGPVVAAVRDGDLSALPDGYRARIREARFRLREARRALDEGRRADALRAALEAGDSLRRVSPRIVARSMVERAEEARRRIPEISTYSKQEKERIARLVRNARHALEAGEHRLAVQRAFYACQLLGLEPF